MNTRTITGWWNCLRVDENVTVTYELVPTKRTTKILQATTESGQDITQRVSRSQEIKRRLFSYEQENQQ